MGGRERGYPCHLRLLRRACPDHGLAGRDVRGVLGLLPAEYVPASASALVEGRGVKPINGKAYRPRQSREPSAPPVAPVPWELTTTVELSCGPVQLTVTGVVAQTAHKAWELAAPALCGRTFSQCSYRYRDADQEAVDEFERLA